MDTNLHPPTKKASIAMRLRDAIELDKRRWDHGPLLTLMFEVMEEIKNLKAVGDTTLLREYSFGWGDKVSAPLERALEVYPNLLETAEMMLVDFEDVKLYEDGARWSLWLERSLTRLKVLVPLLKHFHGEYQKPEVRRSEELYFMLWKSNMKYYFERMTDGAPNKFHEKHTLLLDRVYEAPQKEEAISNFLGALEECLTHPSIAQLFEDMALAGYSRAIIPDLEHISQKMLELEARLILDVHSEEDAR